MRKCGNFGTPGFSRIAATDFVAPGFNRGLDECRKDCRPRADADAAWHAGIGRKGTSIRKRGVFH